MTVSQALAAFNLLRADSDIDGEIIVGWLSELDCKITHELLKPRGFEGESASYSFLSQGQSLLVPEPYSPLYVSYLSMKYDELTGASTYSSSAQRFKSSYTAYADYLNRSHPAKQVKYGVAI